MEAQVSAAIVERYFEKLRSQLQVDVAVAGAGPSGLLAARELARNGRKVAVFERRLAPGGGTWGGGMLMNEVVLEGDVLEVLDELGVEHTPCGDGNHAADSVAFAAALIHGACRAGARIFNGINVEDIVFKDGRVAGVVIQWSPVSKLEMHVDPLVVTARAVLDGTGHPSEIAEIAARKAGVSLDTPTGGVMGEKPVWIEQGEPETLANTKRLCPGLFVSGMAANNVSGGFRMGPIFGGMLHSGLKAARLIEEGLAA
ncbi:MAG: sulfide-dependent adenosine diphosphate thiazole synthase [Candidatus Brocadiia bacterium]